MRLVRTVFAGLLIFSSLAAIARTPATQANSKTQFVSDNPDQTLANGIVAVYECSFLVDLMWEEGSVMESYANGPDPRAAVAVQGIDAINKALANKPFSYPAKEASRKEVLKVLGVLSDSISSMMAGINEAKAAGGWTNDARTKDNDGHTKAQSLPFDGSSEKLIQDPAFQKYLPHMFLEAKKVIPDDAGYALGTYSFFTQPLYLISVAQGSIADQLGLQPMELIESFNGLQPANMDALKQMIKQASGQTVTIKVKPQYEAEKTLTATVPAINVAPPAATANSSPPATAAATSAPSEDDQTLAQAMVYRYDGIQTLNYLHYAMASPKLLKQDGDKRMAQMMINLRALEQLLTFTSLNDPAKEAARQELLDSITKLETAVEKALDALTKAQKAGKWTTETNADVTNAGKAFATADPMLKTVALMKDTNFQQALPDFFLEANKLVRDPAGFTLGVDTFILDSLFFIDTRPNTIGAKLGFGNLMQILEFDGKEPEDLDDLKQMIKADAGKQVTIKVQPEFGQAYSYKVTVPTNLGG